jgi:endonuclease G, mitochondrial
MAADRAAQVAGFMQWIAPAGELESVAAEPRLRDIEKPPWATDEEVERAAEAVRMLAAGEALDPAHAGAVEAIILPQERPVVDVVGGSYDTPAAPFEHLGGVAEREQIEAAIRSIGRIELPGHPSMPYGGTGFVVGDGLLMTNRHVAEIFAMGVGRDELSFRPGQRAEIDFLRERDSADTKLFRIARVIMVHPYWDMALLATEGLASIPALRLAVAEPDDLQQQEVAVIGYPALDPRNDAELQNRIFRGLFNVKRMQPGKLRARADVESFRHMVSALTHDSSTLGGNSGSAVVHIATGMVVALHFAGIYLKANYAVPTLELARDRRVAEAGVNFESDVGDVGPLPSDRYWNEADPPRAPRGPPRPRESAAVDAAAPGPDGQSLSWTFPLDVTVRIHSRGAAPSAASGPGPVAGIEALREPFRDEDFSRRRGYDERFLGVPVPVPRVLDESVVSRLDDGSHLLPYEHFSVVMHKVRRLALLTAANVDADPALKAPEPGRDYSRKGLTGLDENDQEKWFTDPRIPALHQLPDRFFTKDRASFDKGHIVRREDVAWGESYDQVRRANGDTFHVTNCSPQVARFNRSNLKGVWGELENLILAQAKTERYCLLAGPVLRPDDPIFRGVDDDGTVRVAIPRRFWKIVVACSGDELQTFAFVLEQDLADTDLEFAVDELWRSRMIAVPELEELTDLIEFPAELRETDQIDAPGGEAVRAHPGVETYGG